MHFKGEYWIIENMCLKIWYMPLSLPLIYIISCDVRNLNCGSMTCPTGGAPNINYGKNNYGKTGQSALAPWFHRKNHYGNGGHLQELWKKKVRITSGIFWTLMGKNPIMEKSDAGAACLSWTFFFPHNSVGYHIYIYVCMPCIYLSIYLSTYLFI